MRLIKRNNFTELEAERRIASQTPTATKIAKAAETAKPMVIIDNSSEDKQDLFNKALTAWAHLTKKLSL
jgi:dephospho-CoA kinase